MGNLGSYLYISLFGLCVVMAVLVLLMFYIKLQSKIFDLFGKKKKTPAAQPAEPEAPAAIGVPVPDSLVLRDVTDQEAAMIMAIVSDTTSIPLDELRFKSIKRITNNK